MGDSRGYQRHDLYSKFRRLNHVFREKESTVLYNDNYGAQNLAHNPIYYYYYL